MQVLKPLLLETIFIKRAFLVKKLESNGLGPSAESRTPRIMLPHSISQKISFKLLGDPSEVREGDPLGSGKGTRLGEGAPLD